MHLQSDYGYSVGGLEVRNLSVCIQRARQCRVLAHKYPDMKARFRDHVRGWIKEGRWYQEQEARRVK